MALGSVGALFSGCAVPSIASGSSAAEGGASLELVLASEVEWEHLNPARGELSPQAGTLWGDRNGTGPTGFLLKPADGFRSPPHIHNVSYRGVVLRGLLHNDDPDAEEMWMPAGSYWTQPKGGAHITAARGQDSLAYIEIEEGPYLVLPLDEAFDSGEVPINVDASNLVWLDASTVTGLDSFAPDASPSVTYLWGDPGSGNTYGALLRLPAGFRGALRSHGPTLRAVVIQGRPEHGATGRPGAVTLEPGSLFHSRGAYLHPLACGSDGESVLYLRTDGGFDVVSTSSGD